MTTPTCWRPTTGADSVPYPAEFLTEGYEHDSPKAKASWARYWGDREEAANRETADEAVERCRAAADQCEGGAARFELVLDELTHALDQHVADLAGPEGDKWRGLGMGECSFYGFAEVSNLARAHATMGEAWTALDRDAYRKAAADFARIVADLALGMHVKSEGGAA